MRSQIRAEEMSFLREVLGLSVSLSNDPISGFSAEWLRIELPCLHIEKNHLWYLTSMPPGQLLFEVFLACPAGTEAWAMCLG